MPDAPQGRAEKADGNQREQGGHDQQVCKPAGERNFIIVEGDNGQCADLSQ